MTQYLAGDDIVILNDDFWHRPQRVRHKMARAWARAGNRVLWIEQAPYPNHLKREPALLGRSLRPHLEQVEERLWVGSLPPAFPRMTRGGAGNAARALHRPFDAMRIRGYVQRLGLDPRFLVLFQQPARHDLLGAVRHRHAIYYCHDIIGYGAAREAERREEAACCARVDVVFATSAPGRERLLPHNPNTFHVPHAVDPEWWDAGCGRVPPEYEGLAAPRAVFTGVCSERLDLELIRALARRLPGWQFLFVGPIERIRGAIEDLGKEPNVHFLGGRPVEELPGYIAGADALTFPYRLDELQHHVGLPIKFYEYLISGRPILATPFTDFEGIGEPFLWTGAGAEDWAGRLERIGSDPDAERAAALRRVALARENSYAARLALQRECLARALG